jgi:hypothetical protein
MSYSITLNKNSRSDEEPYSACQRTRVPKTYKFVRAIEFLLLYGSVSVT